MSGVVVGEGSCTKTGPSRNVVGRLVVGRVPRSMRRLDVVLSSGTVPSPRTVVPVRRFCSFVAVPLRKSAARGIPLCHSRAIFMVRIVGQEVRIVYRLLRGWVHTGHRAIPIISAIDWVLGAVIAVHLVLHHTASNILACF